MAERWEHWVRIAENTVTRLAEDQANRIIEETDFDFVAPRIATGPTHTTILLYFRKRVND